MPEIYHGRGLRRNLPEIYQGTLGADSWDFRLDRGRVLRGKSDPDLWDTGLAEINGFEWQSEGEQAELVNAFTGGEERVKAEIGGVERWWLAGNRQKEHTHSHKLI